MSKYFPPQYKDTKFHCLYCDVYAAQHWNHILQHEKSNNTTWAKPITIGHEEIEASFCSHCHKPTFWLSERVIYPAVRTSPPANDDLDDSIKSIYNEAADIANISPRAACALLRLAIQMLLEQLGGTGHINEDIKNLVKKGLSPQIQQALDIVRITGNNAVHPGEIDFDDTTDVQVLFGLINIIVDVLITRPKQINEIFERLPEKDKENIKKRDKVTE